MSSEIQDLIANFEDKFDSQFNSETQPPVVEKISEPAKINPEVHEVQILETKSNQSKKEVRIIKHYDVDQEVAVDQSEKEQQQSQLHSSECQNNQEEELENDNQIQENKYRQLSQKLETALKKISSSRKVFESSAVKSTEMLSRFSDYEKKKEKELEAKRIQEQQKKLYGLKSKPQINQKSRQIANEVKKKPLYQRYQKLVDEKKKKQEENDEIKRMEEEKKYQEYLQEFNSHSKIPENRRDTQKFYEDMQVWKEKIDKRNSEKVEQKAKKQLQNYTFKPQINKTSQKLLNKQKRVPIYERPIEKAVVKDDPELTFKPNLKKKITK